MSITISVVMCGYNERNDYLQAQLESVLAQEPDELIFVDDGSTDGTLKFAEEIMDRCNVDTGLVIVQEPTNRGIITSYNAAAAMATSEVICIASCNDLIQPGAFNEVKYAFAEWPDAVLVAGDVTGYPLNWGNDALDPTKAFIAYFSPANVRHALNRGNHMHGAAMYIKRSEWTAQGGYLPQMRWMADWWLNHLVALRKGVAIIPKALGHVNQLKGSYSHGHNDQAKKDEVMREVTSLLVRPEYADVRKAFLTSRAFAGLW